MTVEEKTAPIKQAVTFKNPSLNLNFLMAGIISNDRIRSDIIG